jgi:membrane protein implicated in regulation of membrane protease activity
MFLVAMIALALFVLPPWLGLVAVATGIAVEVAEVGFWVRFLRRYRVRTGAEGLIGEVGEVVAACAPRGRVRLRGEIWHARCSSGAAVGERVSVTGLDGLTLEVKPLGATASAGREEAPNGKGPR